MLFLRKYNIKIGFTWDNNIEFVVSSGSETGLLEAPSLPSLLEVLQRSPDTYYVVSLSRDLLLVPAELHSNSSARPKMTLLLPAPQHVNNNGSDDSQHQQVAMMQIDCQVIHTSLIKLADIGQTFHPSPVDSGGKSSKSPHKVPASNMSTNNIQSPVKSDVQDKDFGSWENTLKRKRKQFRKNNFDVKYSENVGDFEKYDNFYDATNASSSQLESLDKIEEINQTLKDFQESDYTDVHFEPLYQPGHLDQVVEHPHKLHPKHLSKFHHPKYVGNKTNDKHSPDFQHRSTAQKSDT